MEKLQQSEQVEEEALKSKHGAWTCPFCQQTVRLGAYGCGASPDFFKNCLLRDHMIGGECIAYLNPSRARELLMDRD
jgi:hypothetical protein